MDDVAKSAVAGTSSSRYTSPNYWRRFQDRHWLSGAGRDPRAADEFPGGGEAPSDRSPTGPTDRPARCGQRYRRHGARRIRSLQHAAHADTQREHRRRGSGTGGRPSAASDQRCGKSAGRVEVRAWADPADGGDVRRPATGPLDGCGRHPSAADRLFPIIPALASGGVDHSRRRRRVALRFGSPGPRSTFNPSWARSWRSAWPWQTPSCW